MSGKPGRKLYVLSRSLAKSISPVFGAFLKRKFTVVVSCINCRMLVRPVLAWWTTSLLVSLSDYDSGSVSNMLREPMGGETGRKLCAES